METKNTTTPWIWVVERQSRRATHKCGKCKLSEEVITSRYFAEYADAKETALDMWEKAKATERDSREETIKDGKRIVTYITTDIWVSQYDLTDGEFLYRAMAGHLTSSDYANQTPIFSHIL